VARGEVSHTLTHRQLEVRVLEARIERMSLPSMDSSTTYDAAGFVLPTAFEELGMSALAKKVLAQANGGARGRR
jgi:hypothetical protein